MRDSVKAQDIERGNLVSRVYVAYNKRFDMTKVGVSAKPKQRISGLSCIVGCDVDEVYISLPSIKAPDKETMILNKFKDHAALGEWINGHKEEVAAYAAEVCGDMEIDARCMLYIKGEPITSIAKAFNISRQAVLKHLKKHGVYIHPDDVKKEEAYRDAGVCDEDAKSNARIWTVDVSFDERLFKSTRLTDKYKRVGNNLHASNKGFMVQYYRDGRLVQEEYPSLDDVKKTYNIP